MPKWCKQATVPIPERELSGSLCSETTNFSVTFTELPVHQVSMPYSFSPADQSLSSFSGRHCCLWCDITYQQLQVPQDMRGLSSNRTLQSLDDDLQRFLTVGHGNIKKAKEFNNVIRPRAFDIPLDQVKNKK